MSFRSFGSWLLTDTGKSFVFGCAVATSSTIACLHIVPHTFLLDKYREIVQLYKKGFSVPVSKPILERFQKTLDLLEIGEVEKKQFKPFMVYGFDIFSAGTYYSRFGVAVGIPINYTFIDTDVIDKSGIQIMEHSVPWEMEEGRMLLKSLSLSEKAQMYAMAREIQMKQTPKYYTDTFGAVASFIAAYGVGIHLNTKFNLYAKPRSIRFLMYGLLGAFGYCNYVFIKDFSQLHYEQKVDEDLKNKNPIFKEGGKEFYKYILNRNIALRKLMGKVGESNYTPLGNENYLIRQRHLPLVQRKAFFESDVESM